MYLEKHPTDGYDPAKSDTANLSWLRPSIDQRSNQTSIPHGRSHHVRVCSWHAYFELLSRFYETEQTCVRGLCFDERLLDLGFAQESAACVLGETTIAVFGSCFNNKLWYQHVTQDARVIPCAIRLQGKQGLPFQ